MEAWYKRWKQARIASLLLGILACLVIALTATTFRAAGGILSISSAVFFGTSLLDREGWLINLDVGGFEGFGMSIYYESAYFFALALLWTGVALVFLLVKPGKVVLLLYALVQLLVLIPLSLVAISTWRLGPVMVAGLSWLLVVYQGVLIGRYWRLGRGPVEEGGD